MEEQLVSFETAVLAKEKGFNEHVHACYNSKGIIEDLNNIWNCGCEGGMQLEEWFYDYNNYKHLELISTPTQSLLQKWLRDVHNTHVVLIPKFDLINPENINYYWKIISNTNTEIIQKASLDKEGTGSYWTVCEEALEVGLGQALLLINTK